MLLLLYADLFGDGHVWCSAFSFWNIDFSNRKKSLEFFRISKHQAAGIRVLGVGNSDPSCLAQRFGRWRGYIAVIYWLVVWNMFFFPSYYGITLHLTFIFFKMVVLPPTSLHLQVLVQVEFELTLFWCFGSFAHLSLGKREDAGKCTNALSWNGCCTRKWPLYAPWQKGTPTIHQSIFQGYHRWFYFQAALFWRSPLVSLHSKIKGYCAQSRPRPVMGVMKTLNPWWGPSRLCKNIPSLFQNFGDWHLWGTMAKFNWSTAFNTWKLHSIAGPIFPSISTFLPAPADHFLGAAPGIQLPAYAQCGGHGDRLNGIITVFLLAVSWQKRPWAVMVLTRREPPY